MLELYLQMSQIFDNERAKLDSRFADRKNAGFSSWLKNKRRKRFSKSLESAEYLTFSQRKESSIECGFLYTEGFLRRNASCEQQTGMRSWAVNWWCSSNIVASAYKQLEFSRLWKDIFYLSRRRKHDRRDVKIIRNLP